MTSFMLLYNGPATTPEASHEGWPEWFRASATSSSTEARR
jgi:hypothetical protein